MKRFFWLVLTGLMLVGVPQARAQHAQPPNVVFILTDDHRYDAMGFMGHPWLETPHLDRIAHSGVHYRNAFVTTSLCSPSRASILTGMYMHNHGIIDNLNPIREVPAFFPQYLQQAGYQTAFIGKWHMGGGSDDPQPGFDHWISFRGQGQYYPPERGDWSLNINGTRVPQQGYITDELTNYALTWLDERDPNRPFFLYLSHKGIHDPFQPARRHEGVYKDKPFPIPETMAATGEHLEGRPMWAQNQRNSWHGVDFPYHGGHGLDVEAIYRRYAESLLSVDESVGRVLAWLDEQGLSENTLVIYMGDNGFAWGEHGLIDKRTAYEASMRVPLIARWPARFTPGTVVEGQVANIDIAPTILEAAGVQVPSAMDGRSMLGLTTGAMDAAEWRQDLLYEYYWEQSFPQTPTVYALRTNRFKFIQYYGIWDSDELYDLENDPDEKHNLIRDPAYRDVVADMRTRLHDMMRETGVTSIPLRPKMGQGQALRRRDGTTAAPFPDHLLREKNARE